MYTSDWKKKKNNHINLMYFFFLLFFETIKFYYHFLHGTRNQPLWSFNQTLKIFSYISFFSCFSFLFKYIFLPFYNQIVSLLFILKILFSVYIKWKWMNGKKICINFERIAKLSIYVASLPECCFCYTVYTLYPRSE